jgi:hypothetical protein
MEREPAWSPDGQSIAYFSDESGQYALHIGKQTGAGEVKKFPLANEATYYFRAEMVARLKADRLSRQQDGDLAAGHGDAQGHGHRQGR